MSTPPSPTDPTAAEAGADILQGRSLFTARSAAQGRFALVEEELVGAVLKTVRHRSPPSHAGFRYLA